MGNSVFKFMQQLLCHSGRLHQIVKLKMPVKSKLTSIGALLLLAATSSARGEDGQHNKYWPEADKNFCAEQGCNSQKAYIGAVQEQFCRSRGCTTEPWSHFQSSGTAPYQTEGKWKDTPCNIDSINPEDCKNIPLLKDKHGYTWHCIYYFGPFDPNGESSRASGCSSQDRNEWCASLHKESDCEKAELKMHKDAGHFCKWNSKHHRCHYSPPPRN